MKCESCDETMKFIDWDKHNYLKCFESNVLKSLPDDKLK